MDIPTRAARLSNALGAEFLDPREHAERWLASLAPASDFTALMRQAIVQSHAPKGGGGDARPGTDPNLLMGAALDAACGASDAARDLQARFLGGGWTALLQRFSTIRTALRPDRPFPPGVQQADIDALVLIAEDPSDDEAAVERHHGLAVRHLSELRQAEPGRYARLMEFIERHDQTNAAGLRRSADALANELDLGQVFRRSWHLAFGPRARTKPKLPGNLALSILHAAGIQDRLLLGEVMHHLNLTQTAVRAEPPTAEERELLRKEVDNGLRFWARLPLRNPERRDHANVGRVLEFVEWTTHEQLVATPGDGDTGDGT